MKLIPSVLGVFFSVASSFVFSSGLDFVDNLGVRLDKKAPQSLIQEYQSTVSAISGKIEDCDKSEIMLPVEKLPQLNLNRQQIGFLLGYFHFQADFNCSREEVSYYAYLSYGIKQYANGETLKNINNLDDLVLGTQKEIWRISEEYLKLPLSREQRDQLESLDVLQKPFKLFEAVDNLTGKRS